MRIELMGSVKRVFEEGEPADPDLRELLPDLWATLELIRAEKLPADRGHRTAGTVFQYVRDVRTWMQGMRDESRPKGEPSVKFSSRGKCLVVLGVMQSPGHVKYHYVETYCP